MPVGIRMGKDAAFQDAIGGRWLVDDMLRVEDVMIRTAGASRHTLVSEASLYLLNAGGKRLRPALVMITARAGEPGRPGSELAAAAIELVHLATLYHDDVIDGTVTRRGVATTHSKWGTDIAVLAGDYLFACGSSLGASAGGEVPLILAHAIAEVCEGQIVETTATGDPFRRVDDYIEVISLKTAALFRSACDVGAATSGATLEHRTSLVTYGESLGLCFQIVDDLLDLVGDPVVTGKPLGTDLREGVFTAPVLLACERDPKLAKKLSGGPLDLEEILPALWATGAIADGYAMAASYAARGRNALETLPDEDYRTVLETILDGVLAQVDTTPSANGYNIKARTMTDR
ncbi:MAG: polyprenyl synthetase family protein [Actinomycetota bacterium]|nr:polyprenyl synthetase family protein [Actinomycetota bacterium]